MLVVGAGGLGCAVLPYLIGAGIETVGIVDFDSIDTSNLHRYICAALVHMFGQRDAHECAHHKLLCVN